jgi:hypothetical protein
VVREDLVSIVLVHPSVQDSLVDRGVHCLLSRLEFQGIPVFLGFLFRQEFLGSLLVRVVPVFPARLSDQEIRVDQAVLAGLEFQAYRILLLHPEGLDFPECPEVRL